MQRLLTEDEKAEIIEREWAKARAKNPKVVMRVTVQDETVEGGKPRVNVVIAFLKRGCEGDLALSCPRQFLLRADEVIE